MLFTSWRTHHSTLIQQLHSTRSFYLEQEREVLPRVSDPFLSAASLAIQFPLHETDLSHHQEIEICLLSSLLVSKLLMLCCWQGNPIHLVDCWVYGSQTARTAQSALLLRCNVDSDPSWEHRWLYVSWTLLLSRCCSSGIKTIVMGVFSDCLAKYVFHVEFGRVGLLSVYFTTARSCLHWCCFYPRIRFGAFRNQFGHFRWCMQNLEDITL